MTPGQHSRLSLKDFKLDTTIVRSLPRGLAYYYMALPVALEEGAVSVVMAHPDDRRALGVLENILRMSVVPIYGDDGEIRAALDQAWRDEAPDTPQILCFSAPDGPGRRAADQLAAALTGQVTFLDRAASTIETALTVARGGGYSLAVVETENGRSISQLARDSATPLLVVRGGQVSMRRILLVLRGHSPDDSALDWLIPLGQATGGSITLLAVTPSVLPPYLHGVEPLQGISLLLSNDNDAGEHIASCKQRLGKAGIHGTLKLRQGPLESQIADEVGAGAYDLIAIAAEAHGEFVQRALQEIEGRSLHTDLPILVIKPGILNN